MTARRSAPARRAARAASNRSSFAVPADDRARVHVLDLDNSTLCGAAPSEGDVSRRTLAAQAAGVRMQLPPICFDCDDVIFGRKLARWTLPPHS